MRRIIWGILLVLTFMFFYAWLPGHIYNKAPFLLSFCGAALFLFFGILLVTDFRSLKDSRTRKLSGWQMGLIPVFGLSSIALWIMLSMHADSRKDDEIKKSGIKVTGTIVGGSGLSNLRGNGTYDITVQFYTKDNKLITAKIDVDKDRFKQYYKGQEVGLMYLEKQPSVVELADQIESYEEDGKNEITIEYLTKLLKMNPDSVGTFLNTGHDRWEKEDSAWVNTRVYRKIKINAQNGTLAYSQLGDRSTAFADELTQAHFHEKIPEDYDPMNSSTVLRSFDSESMHADVFLISRDGTSASSVKLQIK